MRPWATVVLTRDGDEVASWPLSRAEAADLSVVDGLARAQLAAKRFGWERPCARRVARAGRPARPGGRGPSCRGAGKPNRRTTSFEEEVRPVITHWGFEHCSDHGAQPPLDPRGNGRRPARRWPMWGMRREPCHPMPGPRNHVAISSRPWSHIEYGGIDWTTSSCAARRGRTRRSARRRRHSGRAARDGRRRRRRQGSAGVDIVGPAPLQRAVTAPPRCEQLGDLVGCQCNTSRG